MGCDIVIFVGISEVFDSYLFIIYNSCWGGVKPDCWQSQEPWSYIIVMLLITVHNANSVGECLWEQAQKTSKQVRK